MYIHSDIFGCWLTKLPEIGIIMFYDTYLGQGSGFDIQHCKRDRRNKSKIKPSQFYIIVYEVGVMNDNSQRINILCLCNTLCTLMFSQFAIPIILTVSE